MLNSKNILLKTRIMIIIEVVLIFIMVVLYLLLKNVIAGIYISIFVGCLFLWVLLIILTVNLYNKVKNIKME